jgi:hypothetical protein
MEKELTLKVSKLSIKQQLLTLDSLVQMVNIVSSNCFIKEELFQYNLLVLLNHRHLISVEG